MDNARRKGIIASICIALTGLTVIGTTDTATAAYSDSDFEVNRADLEFILNQITISETHAAGGDLLCDDRADQSWTCVPDPRLPYGLRTVDGSLNNLLPARSQYGAAGQTFPRLLDPAFKDAETMPFDPDGPSGPAEAGVPTSYKQKSGFVADSEPRVISNLIVDQTAKNPAALKAMENTPGGERRADDDPTTPDEIFIPNISPDEGLSAPFNSWFTLFGQFFDHGLDLVSKGGSGTVAVPLQRDDPLYDHTPGARTNFIMLTRATNQPGPDGILGNEDDIQEHTNRTTPYVDQNQTYTSHPAHQVFLREYRPTPTGPVPTGKLLSGDGVDGSEGLATWADIKTQAKDLLGIELDDKDVHNVPLVATDPYGHFVPGANGYPQLVIPGEPNTLLEGVPGAAVDATPAMDAGVAFLDDIAHNAADTSAAADADSEVNDVSVLRPVGTYDDELLNTHFITGDGRGNENIGLSSVHHVFHSEHNRLVGHIEEVLNATGDQDFIERWHNQTGPWNYGERLFQAARFVTEMEYQHLVFEEFARKLVPTIDRGALNESLYQADVNPAVTAEFAHVVYRFGHSMLTDTVAREGFGTEDLPLLDAFLNPGALTDGGTLTHDQGAAAVIQGMTKQTGNGIDEFVVDTLRNHLLGLPLDLAAINMTRARDTGVPSLQTARKTFFAATQDAAVKPYANWEDFRLSMKHRDSIVNFVAAYADDPSVTGADTVAERRSAAETLVADAAFMNLPAEDSGLNDVDFWVGGLAERSMDMGGMLGSTFNVVFEEHMENLQNADRFYYLTRLQGLNLIHQMEANSFSELIMRNTDADALPADAFASQDRVIDLRDAPSPLPDGLTLMGDGTYRWDGEEHITLHGTEAADKLRAGDGDDALWSHAGDDRVEGDVGDDTIHGGPGNDVLTDLFGDDVVHAGPGDDAVNGGPGLDLLFGQSGQDFILHGQEITQSFAGGGTDLLLGGNANDIMTGNEGDDWMEGAKGIDLVQGDNALTFQNDPNGGADILDGGTGNDDHDAEGGNDIMLNNGTDRHAGMLGYDWVTHKGDPDPVDADLDITIFQPPNVALMRSRYFNVEGLSGWDGPDILRGTSDPGDQASEDGSGHELTQAHLDQIEGLRELLSGSDTTGTVPKYATPHITTNQANNIILGGADSDLIEGRDGDDYIDGDAALDVYLEGPGGERADSMTAFQERVFAGSLSPAAITMHREIVMPSGQEDVVDTAYYEDVRANHVITNNNDGTWRVAHVEEDAGGLASGVDTLRNIERIQFADESVDLVPGDNGAAFGTLNLSTLSPTEDEQLSVTGAFDDPQGVQEETIVYTWHYGDDEGEWTPSANGVGTRFTPGDAEAGWPLRVTATFQDGDGTTESITSSATLPVTNVNDDPFGLVVDNTSPLPGAKIRATGLEDNDGLVNDDGEPTVVQHHRWQRGQAGTFTDIDGATGQSYTVTDDDRGFLLRVVVTYTDNQGTDESVASPATSMVPELTTPAAPRGVEAATGVGSATVTWAAPLDDGGTQLLGYEVQVMSGTELVRTLGAIGPDMTSAEVDGLAGETPYRFRVRALNDVGWSEWSDASAEVETTDATTPTLLMRTPLPAVTGVPREAGVTALFSEAVEKVTGETVLLRRVSTNAPVPTDVVYDTATHVVKMTPSQALAIGEEYRVELTDMITDEAGNKLAPESWSFTTLDNVRPVLTSRSPAIQAKAAARLSNIRVTFNEKVTGINASTVRLRRLANNRIVGARVSYNKQAGVVTLNPRTTLAAGARFAVELTSGIRDESGNQFRGSRWIFATRDNVRPRATLRQPARGQRLARRDSVKVRFDESIVGVKSGSVLLRRASNHDRIRAGIRYNRRTGVVTLNPRRILPRNTRLQVVATRQIRDVSGNHLRWTTWRFTTRR